MQVISVENLSKAYGTGENRTDVLHGVSFTVDEGEFVSVMGPSGCGKSTLLYLIGGLETPDGGACLTCGANLAALPDKEASRIRCRDVGFVFQFYNLVENLTVEENIILPLIMAGVRPEDCEERLTKLLDELSLTEKRKATPPTLSGGQQQRVAIARAVITEPKLLLADEPTGNLDSASGARVMELFDRIHREHGIAILMVTHSEEIASHGDRILHMADGKIIEC